MKRALISVSDKTGIVDFAKFLAEQNIEIVSTGGTAAILKENGLKITPISDVTGSPEAFGGRMKTISFQIGSSILFRRDNKQDVQDAKELGISPIDIVVCNLYPFKEVSKTTNNRSTLIENIDIGGPTMIRAAAKNYNDVAILTNPDQYQSFVKNFSNLDNDYRFKLSLEAFKMTAEYDQYIINTLTQDQLKIASTEAKELRYGENPHQKAWMIPWKNTNESNTLFNAEKIQGKELSYNNMIDADAAWKCTSELNTKYQDKFITTIIKHANPCGVAVSDSLINSLQSAWDCDPVSSFGSIISFNEKVTDEIALWLKNKFVEVIIAPEFTSTALELFSKKKNLRIMQTPCKKQESREQTFKSINGAILVQEEDELSQYEFRDVTNTKIDTHFSSLKEFGMTVNKYLKSNSISLVAVKDSSLVLAGGGMGQPNRLDSLKMLAGPRAVELGFEMKDLLLISDAFFPFRDSIDEANKLGIKNILQPGGSIRDEEVITACNEHKIAMEFTNTRHFRH